MPPVQWVPEDLSMGVKWSGRKANHSPPSSAEVKECVVLYLNSPNTPSWHRAQLKKHKDSFTFTFYVADCVLHSRDTQFVSRLGAAYPDSVPAISDY
jgi:hypothetical protein